MRISRLFVPQPLNIGSAIELDDDGAHYVRTVLRLKKGDAIVVFNGDGADYAGTLAEVSRKTVRIAIIERRARTVESPLHITLGLGIARGDRMDWSVQKAVELGVNRIAPLLTERSVAQFKGETRPQRWLHWQKIVQHAAEQSGRTLLPTLDAIETLSDWAPQQQGLKLFLDPYAQTSLQERHPDALRVTLLTGPEGGFADHERSIAAAAGFVPVRLGQRILRTETASLAALAALQMLWGDFGATGNDPS